MSSGFFEEREEKAAEKKHPLSGLGGHAKDAMYELGGDGAMPGHEPAAHPWTAAMPASLAKDPMARWKQGGVAAKMKPLHETGPARAPVPAKRPDPAEPYVDRAPKKPGEAPDPPLNK